MGKPETEGPAGAGLRGRGAAPYLLIGAVAVLLRVCNLGTFSLWLDEVLILDRAHGSLRATWAACAANAEHPPLAALVMFLAKGCGLGETGQRLIPIALGVATVLLLAVWAGRHFGRRTGLLAGWLAAISPLHIRYSQELRPYSYLLFFAMLTLVAVDRLARRPGWGNALLVLAAMVGGLYSHLLYPLVLVPALIVLAAELRRAAPANRSRLKRALALLGGAAAAAFLVYVPWLVETVGTLAARPPVGGVAHWSWRLLGERWEFLTVAARYGDALSVGGALALGLALIGAARAVRSAAGVAALVTVAVGSLGVEVVLALGGHWTHGRYDLMAWPFLVILLALGLDMLLRRGMVRVAGTAALVALSLASLAAVDQYQRIGRPSWDRLAEVVRLVRRPGEPVVVENLTCAISLGHYLRATKVVDADGKVDRLLDGWPAGGSCLLVSGRWPASHALRRLAGREPAIVNYYQTARLCRLEAADREAVAGAGTGSVGEPTWPTPSLVLLPKPLRGQPRSCAGRVLGLLRGRAKYADTRRLDFDAESTRAALAGGWAGFEQTRDGTTFVWVEGREAGVRFVRKARAPLRITMRLWPYKVAGRTQRLRAYVDGALLGEVALQPGPQVVGFGVPSAHLREGTNLLVLQLAYAVAPAEVRTGSRDRRPLAAAVDWITFSKPEAGG